MRFNPAMTSQTHKAVGTQAPPDLRAADDMGISRSDVGAAASAVAAVVAVWITNGVTPGEVFSYLAYLVIAIALPGILLCRLAIRSDRFGLTDVCLGVPVGIALQVVGFVVLASIGLRPIGWYVAPIVGMFCVAALLRRRGRRNNRVRFPGGRMLEPLLIGGLCVSSVVLMALRDFPQHTLPREIAARGVAYYPDMPWHLGNLAAAKRTWPLHNPRISGEPFRYHIGVYVFEAGTSTVAGIDPATLLFRLDPVMLMMLLGAQLVWLGRECGGPGLIGVGAAYMALLAGDASSLWRQTSALFFNLFVTHLYLSPTYFLGLALFVPLVVLSGRLAFSSQPRRMGEGLLWLLLLPACGLTKPTALPILAAGAVAFAGLHWVRHRTLHKPSLIVAIGAVAAFIAVWPVVIPPSADELMTMKWNPLGSLRLTPVWKALRARTSTGAITAIVIAGHAPAILVGIAALAATRRPLTDTQRWLLVLAAAGAGPALLFTAVGNGQLYFWFYGYLALAVIASVGFAHVMERQQTVATRLILLAGLTAGMIGTLSIVFQSAPGVKEIMGARFRMFQRNPDDQVPGRPIQISARMAQGLVWVARHTDPAAVLAVNDQSRKYYYSALTQRAVFLEGSADAVDLFTTLSRAAREQAVARLFGDAGSEAVCETARHFGVDYLINIRTLARPVSQIPVSVRTGVVFENSEIGVVSLSGCRAQPTASRSSLGAVTERATLATLAAQ